MSKRTRVKVISFSSMFLGSLMIFGLVVVMNKFIHSPRSTKGETTITFNVEKMKPNKQDKPKQQIIKKRKPSQKPLKNLAPLPDLGTTISGIAINVPAFQASAFQSLSDSLLGDLSRMDTAVMTEETVDNRPVPVRRVSAEYPARARNRNIGGYVTLSLLIGKNGEVKTVRILEANPFGIFDNAAVSAVKQWQFQPATYNQQAVEVWAKQTIRFEIG